MINKMPEKCTKCKKATGQVTLGKRALKCYKAKYPYCSADDLFCHNCNQLMEEIVARTVAKQKKKKLLERQRRISLEGMQSTTSSSFRGSISSSNTIIERIAGRTLVALQNKTPNTSGRARTPSLQGGDVITSPEIQYTQSQSQPTPRRDPLAASLQSSSQSDIVHPNRQLQPIPRVYESSDTDDDLGVCPIQGPSTSTAQAQPIVRKRRNVVVFADERIIPIYNRRRDFGG